MRGVDAGSTAYVSYWDGGVLTFDISNPTAPAYLGRTIYPRGSSGDARAMVPYDVGGVRYILQNDEDFQPLPDVMVTSSAPGAGAYEGYQQPWSPGLLTDGGQVLTGVVHGAGDGCQAADYAGAAGDVALADAVDPFYVGILQGWTVPCSIGDIDDIADAIRAAGAATITLTAQEPSWGYLRVFREDATGEWQQVGSFTGAPHAFGEFPTPPGSWSIHDTETLRQRGYSAWYSNGIVALDLTSPTAPRMVGQFVPDSSKRNANSLGTGPAEVWGVAIDPATGVVYASDMRTGLWIVRPTGPAAG